MGLESGGDYRRFMLDFCRGSIFGGIELARLHAESKTKCSAAKYGTAINRNA